MTRRLPRGKDSCQALISMHLLTHKSIGNQKSKLINSGVNKNKYTYTAQARLAIPSICFLILTVGSFWARLNIREWWVEVTWFLLWCERFPCRRTNSWRQHPIIYIPRIFDFFILTVLSFGVGLNVWQRRVDAARFHLWYKLFLWRWASFCWVQSKKTYKSFQ